MNKLWIEHSHDDSFIQHGEDSLFDVDDLTRYEYLDTIGLFETSWMIFGHDDSRYGYPVNE